MSWVQLVHIISSSSLLPTSTRRRRRPLSISLSARIRDGWLHNLEDVRATTMQKRGAARRGAARRGLSRASVPAARSRAVNFELVRDATAYVCPECGTKCARSYRCKRARKRKREREIPVSRGTRTPERSFLLCLPNKPSLSRQRAHWSGSAILSAASVGGKCALRRIFALHPFNSLLRKNRSS